MTVIGPLQKLDGGFNAAADGARAQRFPIFAPAPITHLSRIGVEQVLVGYALPTPSSHLKEGPKILQVPGVGVERVVRQPPRHPVGRASPLPRAPNTISTLAEESIDLVEVLHVLRKQERDARVAAEPGSPQLFSVRFESERQAHLTDIFLSPAAISDYGHPIL